MSSSHARAMRTGTPRSSSAAKQKALQIIPIFGIPEIRPGDDLPVLIVAALGKLRMTLRGDDVLVLAQKIISKAEGRLVDLSRVLPSVEAIELAAPQNRDSRLVEVILRESRRVVRNDPVLIMETHHGFVCANAGVDHSNVPGSDTVSLLPKDPDGSASRMARSLRSRTGKRVAIVISDTFGRPWRLGLTNVAIGASGLSVLLDLRGKRDSHGKLLHATVLAVADELAAAAGLVMGKSSDTPAVIIRGYHYNSRTDTAAAQIIRPADEDLFR